MKRTFLAKRNALLSSRNVSWSVFAIALVVLIMLARLVLPNAFWQAFAPVFRASDALTAGTHAFLLRFGDTAALARQNERLASENAALASENQMLQKKSENLADLLGDSGRDASGIL